MHISLEEGACEEVMEHIDLNENERSKLWKAYVKNLTEDNEWDPIADLLRER